MKKLISPRIHGVLDYAAGAAFLLAPHLFAFGGTPALICYVIGLVHIGLTLVTAFPLGALKVVPFLAHRQIEAVVAAVIIAMPWFAGFSSDGKACWFFVAAGLALLAVVALTDYRAVENREGYARPIAHA
ncbi:MAG: hypothetical protein H0W83_07915 [Planctomycetes bacterium]|nr:hypothetical protein [Planctomycetota bacterium]